MAAGDLLVEVGDPGSATTLTSAYTAADTSIAVTSTANWPATNKAVIFAMDEIEVVDGVEQQVANSYNEFEGVVASGTSVTSVDWKRGSGDRNYAASATTRVYIPVSAERENRLVTWGEVGHDVNGNHNFTELQDSNGNEVFKSAGVASAVNEITFTNAATGNAPSAAATGGDANIDLNLKAKGTGKVTVEDRQAQTVAEFATWSPSNSSDNATATFTSVDGSDTLTIPSWANKAIVQVNFNGAYCVSNATSGGYRVKIGSNNGTEINHTHVSLLEDAGLSWADEITLTATGSQTIEIQHRNTGGVGAVRANTSGQITILVYYII